MANPSPSSSCSRAGMAGISASSAVGPLRGCGRCCNPATASPRCGGRGSTSISACTRWKARGCARPRCWLPRIGRWCTHLAALARLFAERDPDEDIYEMLEHTLDDFDDAGDAAVDPDSLRARDARRAGLASTWKTAPQLARPPISSMSRPRSGGAVSRSAGEPGATGCSGCRHSCVRARRRRPAGRIRTCRTASSSPACPALATCWNRAGRAISMRVRASSTR